MPTRHLGFPGKTSKKEIAALVTLDNAHEWNHTDEKFTLCIDLLEISAHDEDSDTLVNILETKFSRLIEDTENC